MESVTSVVYGNSSAEIVELLTSIDNKLDVIVDSSLTLMSYGHIFVPLIIVVLVLWWFFRQFLSQY